MSQRQQQQMQTIPMTETALVPVLESPQSESQTTKRTADKEFNFFGSTAPRPSNATEHRDNGVPMRLDDPNADEFSLDSILVRIGQFGRFQTMVFLLICVPMLFNAIFSIAYVFTASGVDHRCMIPECDTPQSEYNAQWTNFTIPPKDQCNRYASLVSANQSTVELPLCYAENFDSGIIESCANSEFIFRTNEVTISNEFGIYCSDTWKLSLVGTMNNIGQFLGIPLGGFISDRYGRCTSLALGGFVAAIFGIVRSFTPNYMTFLAFELLDNMASSTLYSTCFILGIELVGPKRRVAACSVITIFYAIGEILLAIGAKYTQNWRILLRVLYTPALLLGAYIWLMPESVRWLLSQGDEVRATDILKRAARTNKRPLPDEALEKLLQMNRDKLLSTCEGKFPIRIAFTKLFWRIANCALCWIVNVLVYYGLSLNAVLLDGDKYNNFIFIALVEIPGFFLPLVTMDYLGRRYSLFGYMVISGLCCLSTIIVGSDQKGLQLALFLVGKLSITASFQVLYFFTSEIFPTSLRNSLLSFCSMMGRFGSMLAPQTPLLGRYYANAPAILFAVTAIGSGCLALLFPETTNLVLPTTMQDADNIGFKKKETSFNLS